MASKSTASDTKGLETRLSSRSPLGLTLYFPGFSQQNLQRENGFLLFPGWTQSGLREKCGVRCDPRVMTKAVMPIVRGSRGLIATAVFLRCRQDIASKITRGLVSVSRVEPDTNEPRTLTGQRPEAEGQRPKPPSNPKTRKHRYQPEGQTPARILGGSSLSKTMKFQWNSNCPKRTMAG